MIGLFVYCVIMQLGEMAAFLPSSGAFATFGARFVSEGFGFALGIGYYCQWVSFIVQIVSNYPS
jgi:lysine-specific permease